MTWDIYPFMKEPCNAHFVVDDRVHHEVMFYRETAVVWIPILARCTKLQIDGIQIHLPVAPLFEVY